MGEELVRANRPFLGLKIAFVTVAVALLTDGAMASEKVLHNFGITNTDGSNPYSALIFDGSGSLYGTTSSGGAGRGGTVFETSPNGSGGWSTKVLHNFGLVENDGQQPEAGLIFDGAGNLYGTTEYGGSQGFGTVFELSPNGSGGWTERVLHNFGISSSDGKTCFSALVFDGAGNLYGTTADGGSHGFGTVFEMTPNGGGGWTEHVIHNFGGPPNDGNAPYAGLIFDAAGNLYGTTVGGGSINGGAVFEMTPNGSGGWTTRVLYSFRPDDGDGEDPYAPVTFDSAGNLYGTTTYGASNDSGIVFELTPNGSGGWTETVLHRFGSSGNDGVNPVAGLIVNAHGNLYGTTQNGGGGLDGTVFELTPNGSGGWTERILHNFGFGFDSESPSAAMVLDSAGNLYGTAYVGGSRGSGTIFEIMP
jgi:uncharacterized repeat protein (TIGR03803 family)